MLSYLRPVYWMILCFFVGRTVGKTIDIQYREPEGNPKFITIPNQYRHFFAFKYENGDDVLWAGVLSHYTGYLFTLLEMLLMLVSFFVSDMSDMLLWGDWLVLVFGVILTFGVLLPMAIRYEQNMQAVYDSDWITFLQRGFSLLPKRRCKIVNVIDLSTYEITLGWFGQKRHLAKSNFPVTVGMRLFAVHSNESGFPFWSLRSH